MKAPSIAFLPQLPVLLSACGLAADIDGRGGSITVGSSAQGTIGAQDPQISLPGATSTTQRNTDIWRVELTAGQSVEIAMCESSWDAGSPAFDPLLVVESNGVDNHSDDNSGGGYRGRGSFLTFTPTTTGEYQIYASEVVPGIHGDYTLTITEATAVPFRCPGS
jgi:hypothetical protein